MTDNKLIIKLDHLISRILHRYADWRIGATKAEKQCHKMSDSILLTFDDYGDKDQVGTILNILSAKQIKAMFFLHADWAKQNGVLIKDIKNRGHVVGNHTLDGPNLMQLSDQCISYQLSGGLPGPWFRAPQGRYNSHIRKLAQELGYVMCYWTIDSLDWKGTSAAKMRHTILSELKPGAVILFHLHGKHTAKLLPGLIDEIRASGYEFTKLNETWTPAEDQLGHKLEPAFDS